MAQFIQVGNAFINVDQVTVLDVDRPQGRPVLRVYGQAPGVVWEGEVSSNAEALLKSHFKVDLSIPGRDSDS